MFTLKQNLKETDQPTQLRGTCQFTSFPFCKTRRAQNPEMLRDSQILRSVKLILTGEEHGKCEKSRLSQSWEINKTVMSIALMRHIKAHSTDIRVLMVGLLLQPENKDSSDHAMSRRCNSGAAGNWGQPTTETGESLQLASRATRNQQHGNFHDDSYQQRAPQHHREDSKMRKTAMRVCETVRQKMARIRLETVRKFSRHLKPRSVNTMCNTSSNMLAPVPLANDGLLKPTTSNGSKPPLLKTHVLLRCICEKKHGVRFNLCFHIERRCQNPKPKLKRQFHHTTNENAMSL